MRSVRKPSIQIRSPDKGLVYSCSVSPIPILFYFILFFSRIQLCKGGLHTTTPSFSLSHLAPEVLRTHKTTAVGSASTQDPELPDPPPKRDGITFAVARSSTHIVLLLMENTPTLKPVKALDLVQWFTLTHKIPPLPVSLFSPVVVSMFTTSSLL